MPTMVEEGDLIKYMHYSLADLIHKKSWKLLETATSRKTNLQTCKMGFEKQRKICAFVFLICVSEESIPKNIERI